LKKLLAAQRPTLKWPKAEALAAKLLEEAIGRAATNLEVAQASGDAAARKMWSEALNALNPMQKVRGGPLR